MKKGFLLLNLFLGLNLVLSASGISARISEKQSPDQIHTWTGAVSNAWDLAANWNPATVPLPTEDVVIPLGSGNNPLITSDKKVICRNATIQTATEKYEPASGRILMVSGGEIVIDGSVTIKAGANVVISSDGAVTINGDLKIVTGGNLTIQSGGSLITNGNVQGIANVQREVPDWLKWHLISSPVYNQIILNGVFAPLPADFTSTPSTCFDFYKFNFACDPLHWINLRNGDLTVNTSDFGTQPHFVVNEGYLVAYNSCFPKLKVFTGTLNTGDMNYSLSSGSALCNWDLLGNPYPSAFKWSDILNKSNLANGYYYIWNEYKDGGAGYEAYLDDMHSTSGVDGNIPAEQGFFVKVGNPGSSLTVPNTARIHDVETWLKKEKDQPKDKLKLTLSNASNFDETYLLFENTGNSPEYWYDAEKILSLDETIPQVFTVAVNNQKNLISSLPSLDGTTTVPVGMVLPFDGDYSIGVEGLESFESLPGIILEDMKTGNTQNLLKCTSYNFSGSKNDDGIRFLLHFFNAGGNTEPLDGNPISIYACGKSLYISCSAGMENSKVSVYNILGQQFLVQPLPNQPLNEVTLDVNDGYYFVKVQTQSYVKTKKIYLRKY